MKTFTQYSTSPTTKGVLHAYCVGRMRYPALTPGLNGRMEYTWSGWRHSREKAIEEAYCKAFGIDNAFQSVICQSRKAYEREYRHAEEYRNSGPSLWSPGYRLHTGAGKTSAMLAEAARRGYRVHVADSLRCPINFSDNRWYEEQRLKPAKVYYESNPTGHSWMRDRFARPPHGGYPTAGIRVKPWRFGDNLPGLNPKKPAPEFKPWFEGAKPTRIEARYVPLDPPPFDRYQLANFVTCAMTNHIQSFKLCFYGEEIDYKRARAFMSEAKERNLFGLGKATLGYDWQMKLITIEVTA